MRLLGFALLALAGCARPEPQASRREPGSCEARARVTSERPLTLDVEMRCRGRELTGFRAAEAQTAPHVSTSLRRDGARFTLPSPTRDALVRYRVNLDAVAREAESFDVALRSGATLVAPVSTWLLHPEPLEVDVPVRLRVETPPGFRFETGLGTRAGAYALEAHEIPVGTYAVFGGFESQRVVLGDSSVQVAFADGALDTPKQELATWIGDSARAVGDFFRRFPVPRVHVTVIPVPGREGVLFGKVLPESAPGVVLLVGEHTKREKLYQDWILVHELFHLGVPSFSGEGKWFDEGLATYYEPIIRARAGWRSEQSVWDEFHRAMPLGLDVLRTRGLERGESFRDVYWGGAVVVMLADVEVRKRSGGERGLEDGLRGVLAAGGHASEVWPLGRTLALADESSGVEALQPLAKAHAHRAKPVDLDAVWRELGVEARPDGVRLNGGAPLAAVRSAILRGGLSTSSKLGSAPKSRPMPAM